MVKTQLGGICGTDMSAVNLKASTYSTPLVSFPFVLGHENIGSIEKLGKNVSDWRIGDRVVVEPALWCKPRGFAELCEYCAIGEINHCIRITEGDVPPAVQIGLCSATGGSWSQYFVAHQSQLYSVPDLISEENALMIEPFAIGLHAVIEKLPDDDDTVLIIGAGSIGLCTLAALRSLGSKAEIIVVGKYDYQAKAAERLGASRVLMSSGSSNLYQAIADETNAVLKKPVMGKPLVIGGIDVTYDCVGSSTSLEDALRFTRNGGRVIFVGEPGVVKNLDWTPMFTQDLQVKPAYLYSHAENYNDEIWKTFDLAIELMNSGKVDLGWMVTHKFVLSDYRRAFELANQRGKNKAIKIVFEF
ncbi:MAG: zinc-binding dehydrogenase [Chloroflexota bacterium]|nr:MAG: zinc-binding dehydrogenase [Chloroflexota bacterium]